MRKYLSHLNSAVTILESYKGDIPFAHFIKKYFAQHKKYGSKDRKSIASICYAYFRIGHAYKDLPLQERVLIAVFLMSDPLQDVLMACKPEWNNFHAPISEKLQSLQLAQEINIFPWKDALSASIDALTFERSHLQQPLLFLRARKGKENALAQNCIKQNIPFQQGESSFALSNGTSIDALGQINRDFVVQDISSQKVGELLALIPLQNGPMKIWDCCAASGGKSILAQDVFPAIELTVSDNRETILKNLHQRFREAGIRKYHSFQADLSLPLQRVPTYDLVIADVPCSGSGTWGRTPEQLCYFDIRTLENFVTLQRKIISQVVKTVKPGGYFLYITCSVFQAENEMQVAFLQKNLGLHLIQDNMIKGYEKQADSMYAALLYKK